MKDDPVTTTTDKPIHEWSKVECLEVLRSDTPLWNRLYREARAQRGHRADLRGADLGGADLHRADLRGADLGGAYLGGADLADGIRCTGRVLCISPVAGYDVTVFATEDGHRVRAGCWLGTLDACLDRLDEEDEATPENVAEVTAFVAYASAVVAAWPVVELPPVEEKTEVAS